MNKMKFSGSAVFGIILIAVGAVSLLSSLNYFDSWNIFSTFWPLVIVLFGVKSLIDHRSSTLFGIVLIAVGAFLQLDELGLWYLGDIYVRELIIPAVIILIGLYFILPKGNRDDHKEARRVEKVSPAPNPVPEKPAEPQVKKPETEVKKAVEKAEAVKEEVSQEAKDAAFTEKAETVEKVAEENKVDVAEAVEKVENKDIVVE